MSRSRSLLCLFTLLIVVAASASASTVGVSIAPTTTTVPLGGTQQFSATVTGTTNHAVSWSTNGGTVSSSGLYTAPLSGGSGQVVLDTVGPNPTGSAVTGGSTLTWSHTASGSNRLVMVGCSLGALSIPPFTLSVTYGGINMLTDLTSLKKVNGTGDGAVQMFYLVAPPAGLQPVTATLAGTTADLTCGSVSFTGVNQSVALRNAATSTGFSSTPSISVSSAAGDMVINAIDYGCAGGSSNQTLAWMRETNCTTGGSNGAQSIAAGAATVATGYTIASDQWGMVAVDIVAASGQNGPYTVTATSQADPTKAATATVTISQPTTVAVSLSPTSASILANGTQQFSATVTGTTNQAVTWSTSGGTVSAGGLYTAPLGGAQVLMDAVGPSVAGTSVLGGSTVNWLHTASGSNRLVEVGCSVGKWSIPAFTLSATYGGISMIADPNLKKVNSTGNGAVQMFYLVAPPTGQQTVAVTLSGTTADLSCGSVSFTGVNQSTPLRNATTSTGFSTTPSITVNGAVGDLVVNAIDYGCSGGSSTQTLAWMKQLNCTTGGGNGAQSIAPGAASVTMGYTIANDEWGMVAVDIAAASGQNGPYTVTATSQADPTKSATATVTISVPTAVAVSLSPTSASILANGTQQFTATVTGTSNTAVTWSATGGSVSSAGLYTAPSTAGTYTVTATSAADTTKKASASVTVTAAVSVSVTPNNATTTPNGKVQFTASVTGSTNTAVTWRVASGGGTVSTSGLYTAPSTAGSASVVATSVADTRSSALANVTISATVTVLLSASPTAVSFGSVLVGQSGSQTVNLSNTGNSSVTVSSASFTGSGFGVTGLTFPFTVAAAGSKSATLTFAPAGSGAASGSVSFVSNATNSPATATLTGSGTGTVQHRASLNWQPTANSTGYNVYRATVTGGPYTRVNSALNAAASYADSTVASGTTYYYVVTDVSSSGMESAYSSQVTAAIPAP